MVDKYYTPPEIAHSIVEAVPETESVSTVVDPTCGYGSLLDAADLCFPDASIIGFDIDKNAIDKVKNIHSTWYLDSIDITNESSRSKSSLFNEINNIDVVLLNPPFSMGTEGYAKRIHTEQGIISCSRAFYYVLICIKCFSPNVGLFCLLPESTMFSELDSKVRDLLSENYSIEIVDNVNRSQFKGSNANTLIVSIVKDKSDNNHIDYVSHNNTTCDLNGLMVRGGLQVHERNKKNDGKARFLHTSHFCYVKDGSLEQLPHVEPINRGLVKGEMVVLPRVGNPSSYEPLVLKSKNLIQLSDCVVALFPVDETSTSDIVRIVSSIGMSNIYKGTGPKYVTLRRLTSLLRDNGLCVDKKNNHR